MCVFKADTSRATLSPVATSSVNNSSGQVILAGRQLPARVQERLREVDAQEQQLAAELADPAVASDHRASRERSIKRAAIARTAEGYRLIMSLEREAAMLEQALSSNADPEFAALAKDELPVVQAKARAVLDDVLSGLVTAEDNAVGSVMMELRAGTGGDEAALWCRDLMEMYSKYAARKGWACELLDITYESDAGGVKHAVLNIRGEGVWAALNFEAGVHSVKRVPATEAQGRIHTSTASVAVLAEPENIEVKIDWINDVEETVTTSQGPGGQNVNKVATAVQMHHKPSGIIIRMQESKSQQQNRALAKRLLLTKLYDIEQRKKHEARAAARRSQIGSGDRSEKIRTYRWKEGIVADERLPDEYQLRDLLAGDLAAISHDLAEQETKRRLSEL